MESLHDLYGYTNANPIMLVDPSGRASQMDALTLALNIVGIVGGVLGAIWTAGAATVGMAVLGIAARTFSLADAVFTAAETYAIHTDTKFMPDEAALGLGVGLAVAGLGLGVAAGVGKLSGRTAAAIPDGVHINAGRGDTAPNPKFVEPPKAAPTAPMSGASQGSTPAQNPVSPAPATIPADTPAVATMPAPRRVPTTDEINALEFRLEYLRRKWDKFYWEIHLRTENPVPLELSNEIGPLLWNIELRVNRSPSIDKLNRLLRRGDPTELSSAETGAKIAAAEDNIAQIQLSFGKARALMATHTGYRVGHVDYYLGIMHEIAVDNLPDYSKF